MMMREDRRVPFPSTLRLLLFSNIYIYLMLSFIMIIWGIHTKVSISKDDVEFVNEKKQDR